MIGFYPVASQPVATSGVGSVSLLEFPETTILKLLMGRLRDLSLPDTPEVVWPNQKFDPPAGIYLKTDILWNRNMNRFVPHDSSTERRGIFQVTVVAPSDIGAETPHNIAGAVGSHFGRGTIVGRSIKVCVDEVPSLSPPMAQPDRYRIPVSIRFYAFT